MVDIVYSPKDIFEQDFRTTMRGYSKEEVDEFLDDVIKDYETYSRLVAELKAENEKLRAALAEKEATSKTSAPTDKTEQKLSPKDKKKEKVKKEEPKEPEKQQPVSNYDLLKRISRLEKEVFGKQITE